MNTGAKALKSILEELDELKCLVHTKNVESCRAFL